MRKAVSILCNGEISVGFHSETVKANLSEKWQLNDSEIDNWLTGSQVFYRTDLCPVAARALHAELQQLGLKVTIIEADSVDSEQALPDDDSKYAQKFLSFATTLLIIGFVSDNTLLGSYLIGHENLDFGILPYIPGLLTMCIGLHYFAKIKGYSGYLGLLGFTGLLGLGIVLVLPNKEGEKKRRLLQSSTLFALGCLVLGIINVSTLLQSQSQQIEYLDRSNVLAIDRNEFSSLQLDSRAVFYHSEWQQLLAFIEQGFADIDLNNMRPAQQEKVISALADEATRFFVWINYQAYLHEKSGADFSQILEEKQINIWKQQFVEMAWKFKNQPSLPEQSIITIEKHLGVSYMSGDQLQQASSIHAIISQLFDAFQMAKMQSQIENHGKEIKLTMPDLSTLQISVPANIEAKFYEQYFTVKFNSGNLKQYKPVTIWMHLGNAGGVSFQQISSGFPNYLLMGYNMMIFEKQVIDKRIAGY